LEGGHYVRSLRNIATGEEKREKEVHTYSMKAYRGNTGITPLILNLGTRWR